MKQLLLATALAVSLVMPIIGHTEARKTKPVVRQCIQMLLPYYGAVVPVKGGGTYLYGLRELFLDIHYGCALLDKDGNATVPPGVAHGRRGV